MKKFLRIILLAVLAGAVFFGYRYFSPEQQLNRLNSQSENLIQAKQYQEAFDLYTNALDEGKLDHDKLIEGVSGVCEKWFTSRTIEYQDDPEKLFALHDTVMERIPELKEQCEESLAMSASLIMSVKYSGDLKGLNQFWKDVITRYYWSDTICEEIDSQYRMERESVLEQNVNDLVNAGFIDDMINKEYKKVFDAFEVSDLRANALALKKQIDFPFYGAIRGKTFVVDFVNGGLTIYYGEYSNEKRNGEGIHLFFYKGEKVGYKSLVYGNFTNDMLNGEFEEYSIVDADAWREGIVTGNMVDSKYDGQIQMTLTTPKSTTDYTMRFDNGKAIAEGSYVDDNGETIYVVASTWIDGKQRVYGYPKDFYDCEHGLQPWYERPY